MAHTSNTVCVYLPEAPMDVLVGDEHLYFSKPHAEDLLHSPREWAGFAAGVGSPIQHHLCLWLPGLLSPSVLSAAHPATRRDEKSLWGYVLALWRL